MGRECGRSAGKEALTKFSCRWSGRNVPRISTCFHRSSLLLAPSRTLFLSLICHLQSRTHRATIPAGHSPLLSLLYIYLSLSILFFFFFLLLISYPSLILPPRGSNRFAEHRVSAFQRTLVPVATCYFRRRIRPFIPSFLPFFLERRLRNSTKLDG